MTSKYVYIPSPEYVALMETAQRCKSKLRDLISHKNDEFTVTCVGLYNQGKSQLLNALVSDCNNSTFSVSDRRETVITKKVKCGDIVYVDTPGVNAPYEHERITMNRFQKCDVIVFVMCNDGSVEDRIVYDKIATNLALDQLSKIENSLPSEYFFKNL